MEETPDRSITDQALRELEAIFHHATLGIAFTRNRQLTRCNPKLIQIFGFADAALEGMPTRVLFPSDADYEAFSALVRNTLQQGKPISVTWTFRHQGGHDIVCRVNAKPVNPTPVDEGTVWLFEDITEAERQAKSLRRTMDELEAILQNAPVSILFTAERRITRVNEQFEQMFGYSAQEALMLPGRALFPSDREYEEITSIAGPALSVGRPISHEIWMRRQDGSTFWGHLIAYVVNPSNTSEGTIWMVSDRSAARERELALHNAVALNQAILDAAIVGIVFLRNRVVESCNPMAEQILGYVPGTLVGATTRSWYPNDEEFEAVGRDVYPVLESGMTHVREVQMRRQNGELFWCRIGGRRISDEGDPVSSGSIWVIEDTSERHAAQEGLINVTGLLQGIFDGAGVAIIATHIDGRIRLMNATAERWLGYSADELIDKLSPALLHDPEEVAAYARVLSEELGQAVAPGFDTFVAKARAQGFDEQEWTYITRDGHRFPVHLSVSVLRDYQGEINGYLGIALDITDRRRADEAVAQAQEVLEQRVIERTTALAAANTRLQSEIAEREAMEETMRRMAHYDALTGLPNRNLLHDRIEQAITQARRHGKRVGLLFIDLDRFKTINDSLGHHIGDLLLGQVAQRMSATLRDCDTLARLGGDEFMLLVPETESAPALGVIAGKLIDALALPIAINEHQLHISPSIGICCYPEDGHDRETLMRNADTAMYHAKAAGRNNFQYFEHSMNVEVDDRFQLETALRYALERQELSLHYQPLVDAASLRICGVEALLRWHSGQLGSISPGRFIPVAEESGSIVPIGSWVLETACRQIKAWHTDGYPGLVLAVNLSPLQFRQRDLLETIRAVLERTGFPPHLLELELTESSLMHNVGEVIETLHQLVSLGVRLAIDDFGTGYSSLAYLKHFPVHKLKIDQSFVRDLQTDELSAGIVSTVISLANTLGLDTLAEGVETGSQQAQLSALGCRYLQGYLFSRPLPADAMRTLLASKAR